MQALQQSVGKQWAWVWNTLMRKVHLAWLLHESAPESRGRLANAEKIVAWVTGEPHIGQGEVAEGAAGRQLGQELQGVAEELQGAQVRQRAQVNHRGGQPVGLQG